jgi:serine/threonine-protein kinase TTK/MPS1
MLESIAEIHNLNLIHRDIKPANFIIQNGTLKLIDFGISKYVHPETKVAHVETPMGTVSYMAPETFYDDRSRRKKYTVVSM